MDQVDSVLRSTLPGMTLDESYEAKEKPGREKGPKDMRLLGVGGAGGRGGGVERETLTLHLYGLLPGGGRGEGLVGLHRNRA